jgi:hypothetical protein
MGKALLIGLALVACATLAASSSRAQEMEEFRFVPELPRFSQDGPFRIERNGGALRLGDDWQVNAHSVSFRPTDTMRIRYEDVYVERRLTDRLVFEVGATRFKHREQERAFRDVTYAVRFRFAF